MKKDHAQEIELRLLIVLRELEAQSSASSSYSPGELSFTDEMRQLSEYVKVAGEYEIAYESIVATLSAHLFVLTGPAAVALLEAGLLLGYKTSRKEDALFDRR